VFGRQLQGALETALRLFQPGHVAQCQAEIEKSLDIGVVDADGAEMMLQRLFATPDRAQCVAEIGMMRGVVGFERQRLAVMGDGGVETALPAQRHADIVVQFGVEWIALQQAAVDGNRFRQTTGAMRRGRMAHHLLRLGAQRGHRRIGLLRILAYRHAANSFPIALEIHRLNT
jgi:anti-sigma factor RsiW